MDISSVSLRLSARRSFPAFYASASSTDEVLMDGLVLTHAALVVGINAPRDGLPPELRAGVEKTTDATERAFTAFREEVRTSPAFSALSIGEQLAIERLLFNVPPPCSPGRE